MTISLTPETQRILDERLKAGGYASPDEAVREGLLLLAAEADDGESAFRELKARLERGAAQADRGELVDGETAVDRILNRLAEQGDRSGAA